MEPSRASGRLHRLGEGERHDLFGFRVAARTSTVPPSPSIAMASRPLLPGRGAQAASGRIHSSLARRTCVVSGPIGGGASAPPSPQLLAPRALSAGPETKLPKGSPGVGKLSQTSPPRPPLRGTTPCLPLAARWYTRSACQDAGGLSSPDQNPQRGRNRHFDRATARPAQRRRPQEGLARGPTEEW